MSNKAPISLKEYAKSRKARGLPGGSTTAVSRAIRSGRLTARSVVLVDGDPKILSAAAADEEWRANTRPTAPRSQPTRQEQGTPVAEMTRAQLLSAWLHEGTNSLVLAMHALKGAEDRDLAAAELLSALRAYAPEYLTEKGLALVEATIEEALEALEIDEEGALS